MQHDVIVGDLTPEQKVELGPKLAERLLTKRPADDGAKALGARLSGHSSALAEAVASGPTARGARAGLVDDQLNADRQRDRAVSALSTIVRAWSLRDDKPEKQRAAAFIKVELIPKGTDFIRYGYPEQTAAMNDLLDGAAKPNVVAALNTLGASDFITNVHGCQQRFVEVSGGKSDAHVSARNATRKVTLTSRRWDSAMRAILNYIDDVYDDAIAAEKAEREEILQPLIEANAVARARATKAAPAAAAPAATPVTPDNKTTK